MQTARNLFMSLQVEAVGLKVSARALCMSSIIKLTLLRLLSE